MGDLDVAPGTPAAVSPFLSRLTQPESPLVPKKTLLLTYRGELKMAEATNVQMQKFADERIRVRAEQIRALYLAVQDDVSAIDDAYARAVGTDRWTDARTDGPPHLLKSGNSAAPDDLLNYNTWAALFLKFMAGTFASQGEANGAAANWAVLVDACVRPVSA